MRKEIYILLGFVALLSPQVEVNAQQILESGLFRYNQMFYNPAFTGIEEKPVAALHGHRFSQYLNEPEFNKTTLLRAGFEMPVSALHGGIGVVANFQQTNVPTFLDYKSGYKKVGLQYSYHLQFAENWKLGIGAQASVNQYSRRSNTLNGKTSRTYPELASGFWLQGKRFYFGGSIQNLLKSTYAKFTVDNLPYYPYNNEVELFNPYLYTLNAGYTGNIGSKLKFSPVLLSQFISDKNIYGGDTYIALSLNNTFIIADKFHIGGAVNTTAEISGYYRDMYYDSFSLNAGFELAKYGHLMLSRTFSESTYRITELRLQARF